MNQVSRSRAWRAAAVLVAAVGMMLAMAAPALAIAPDVESFSGTVHLPDGSPAGGADVSVMWWDLPGEIWYEYAWDSTDENGDYSIFNVVDGKPLAVYFSEYDNGRYQAEYFDDAHGLDQATIWQSSTGTYVGPYASIDATLEAAVGAFGSVTDSSTGDPLALVDVTLEKRPWEMSAPAVIVDWTAVETTKTSAEGAYAFSSELLPDGFEYRVVVRVDEYLPSISEAWDFDFGYAAQEWDFALQAAPPLATGTVVNAATDEPMPGVPMYLADPMTGEHFGEAYTDENGEYSFPYLADYGDLPFNFKFKAYADGFAYTWVGPFTYDGSGTVQHDFALTRLPRTVTRVAGVDRYVAAASMARKGWDPSTKKTWPGVSSIVIANGETGREADPLCAAPLAGVLDAPILLVKSTGLPLATRAIITEVALQNPGVKIYLVGGTASVPDSVWTSIKSIKGVSTVKTRLAGSDRYSTSVAIAKKTATIRASQVSGGHVAGVERGVLLVAGDDPAAYYDALAATPGAFAMGQPMLAVKQGSVPASVKQALGTTFADQKRFIASSPTYISSTAVAQAGGVSQRLTTSSNRYTAAAQIAGAMIDKGWVSASDTALAAKIPDALAGGAFMGKRGGVMLFTDSTTKMQGAPKYFIESYDADIRQGWVIGGEFSVNLWVMAAYQSMLDTAGN